MLLAKHDVRGLRRLLSAAIRKGVSSKTIISRLQNSINGLYTPHGGFSNRDYDLAFLSKALGGPRLLQALQKAHGYPAVSTIKENHKIPQLLSSLSIPSKAEIAANIDAFFDPEVRPLTKHTLLSGNLPGMVIMVDGIALEEVCRYNAS
jgi:hypothetical protein